MQRSRRTPSALGPAWAWILGLAAGFIGTWIAILEPIFGVPIYALVAIGLLLRVPRAAFGGAMLFMSGVWFAYFHYSMIRTCQSTNTGSGSCAVIDANGTLIPALTFLVAGTAVSVYALFFGKRSLRGGE